MEQTVETTTTPKLSQKDAVYKYVVEALGSADKPEGTKLRDLVTKEVRKIVRTRLYIGLKNGEIKISDAANDSKMKKYASGLINNWLKKDERFN